MESVVTGRSPGVGFMRAGDPSTVVAGGDRRQRRLFFVVVGLCSASSLVWQSTSAAFFGRTSNDANEFRAGTVAITDADGGRALFTTGGLAPGATGTACIGVTYTGSIAPSAVKIYFSDVRESDAGASYRPWSDDAYSEMDDNLNLEIQMSGSDLDRQPGFNDCNPSGVGSFADLTPAGGTGMRSLIAARTDFSSGLPTQWNSIAPGMWRIFRFSYRLSPLASNSVQEDGLEFTVVWEAQH